MRLQKGNVLIYTLLVINLALILVYIVSSRTNSFLYDVLNEQNNSVMTANIKKKADVAFRYTYLYNLNGTGFTNTRLCPTNIVFSGTTLSGGILTITGTSQYFNSSNIPYCSGSNNSGTINIFYQDNFLSFSGITFSGSAMSLLSNDGVVISTGGLTYTGNLYTANIADSQTSVVTFSGNIGPTNIDSNSNSDNYRCSSTGSYSYSGNVCDDDIYARKNNLGYIENESGYFNIFWNNPRINDFIHKNPNNTDSGVALLGETSTGFLFLNISDGASLKLVQFDKDKYDSTSELKKIGEYDGNITYSSSGFISFSNGSLALNPSLSNGIIFDFTKNYYGLFLSYSGGTYGNNLQYILSGVNGNNYPIIINPLDDSDSNYFKYLGYDIIIRDNKYYSKINQIEAPKNDDLLKNNFVN